MAVDFLFVNQPRFNGLPVQREIDCQSPQKDFVAQPLALIHMAAAASRAGASVKVVDANVLNEDYSFIRRIIKKEQPKFVVGCIATPTIYHDIKLGDVTKKNSDAFFGVWWPVSPEIKNWLFNKFPYVDFIIDNEPEFTIEEIVNKMDRKCPLKDVRGLTYKIGKKGKFNGYRKITMNLDLLPIPLYAAIPMKKYYSAYNRRRPMTLMRTARGCVASCIFCIVGGQTDIYRGYSRPWRAYSPGRALEEIRYVVENFGIREINFFDSEFTIDKKRVQEICAGIIKEKLDVVWICESRVDSVDEKTLEWMKRAGCYGIAYGVESANKKVLETCKKRITPKQVERAITITKSKGIECGLFFMIGLPGETHESIKETFRFAKSLVLKYGVRPQCTVATPYPGTGFYEIAAKNGWIKGDISDFEQTTPAIGYPGLTREDLEKYHKLFYTNIILHPKRLIRRVLKIRNSAEIQNMFMHIRQAASVFLTKSRHIR